MYLVKKYWEMLWIKYFFYYSSNLIEGRVFIAKQDLFLDIGLVMLYQQLCLLIIVQQLDCCLDRLFFCLNAGIESVSF